MEGFWSISKRRYVGTYQYMSKKHLQKYVDEFTRRHEIWKMDTVWQMEHLSAITIGSRLMYRILVSDWVICQPCRRDRLIFGILRSVTILSIATSRRNSFMTFSSMALQVWLLRKQAVAASQLVLTIHQKCKTPRT